MKECVSVPSIEHVKQLTYAKLPKKIIICNLVAVALITVGSLAPIYAGVIEPDLRATCITLSSIVIGLVGSKTLGTFAAILLLIPFHI